MGERKDTMQSTSQDAAADATAPLTPAEITALI